MALSEQELQQQAENLVRYGRDFFLFCQEVLGYGDLLPVHHDLGTFLQTDRKPKLILMPRYSFKSSICTVGYALWRLTLNDSLRILIYSDATARAESFLSEIKHHLLALKPLSRFREVYGAWEVDPKKGVWNQSALVIRPRTTAHAEPSIDTAGVESSKVGAHYDLIIFDDLVTRENVTTKDLMDKVVSTYQAARSLLVPGGELLLVGTRWHFGDLYGRLLVENETTQQFATLIRDAEKAPDGTPYPFAPVLTKEFLAEQKKSQGTRLYSALYRNAPQDDETAIFKTADFAFYNPLKTDSFFRWVKSLYLTCVLDAIPPPSKEHGDDAAIVVVGTDADQHLYLLDAVAGRLTPEQQITEVLSLHQTWHFRKFGLETNAFQRTIKTDLERRLALERTTPGWEPFSIVEFTGVTQGNKEQRIQGLQPWHEQGRIHFPGTRLETLSGVWSQLAYQMIQFPHARKDDLLDALAYHLQLKRPGSVAEIAQTIPWNSPAGLERRMFDSECLENQQSPRWLRKPVEGLSFS